MFWAFGLIVQIGADWPKRGQVIEAADEEGNGVGSTAQLAEQPKQPILGVKNGSIFDVQESRWRAQQGVQIDQDELSLQDAHDCRSGRANRMLIAVGRLGQARLLAAVKSVQLCEQYIAIPESLSLICCVMWQGMKYE